MPQPYELNWSRLPLEGAHNVRELGGYPAGDGCQTHYHRFLRSDGLSELTEADRAFLHAYGVRLVLDLRDPSEVEERPDLLLGDDVRMVNVPMLSFDMAQRDEIAERFAKEPPTYEQLYDLALGNHDAVARCFALIAEAPEGCVLFHCAVGKDRTGILAMLLMALAGCDKWDCVANYVQTRPNLMRHEWFAQAWEYQDMVPLNDSPAHAMEHAWETVQAAGGVVPYLHSCGVSYEDLARVRERLVG